MNLQISFDYIRDLQNYQGQHDPEVKKVVEDMDAVGMTEKEQIQRSPCVKTGGSQSVDKVATLVKFMAYAINFNTGG